jgi:protein-disulfide isomerase/uncharacterized membrane protein
MTSKTKLFAVLLLLSVLALLDHSYLSYEYYNLHSGMAEGRSLCNISSHFNCDAVAASSYAQLLGIPMALLGAITQAILLILLVAGQFRLSENSERTRRYFFWGVCLVALVSVVMGSLSTFKLGTYCLFCMGAYLLSFLSLLVAWFYRDSQVASHFGEDLAALFSTQKWVLGLGLVIPLGGYILNGVTASSYSLDKIQPMIRSSILSWQTAPEQKFDLNQGLLLQAGHETPIMTIVEFADFRCPHCRLAYPGIDAFVEGHSDVRLVFKSFPLDGTCNKALSRSGDGLTCKLALTAFCAEDTAHKGWDTHHWIYDHQEQLQSADQFPDMLHKICADVQLDEQKMKDCINSDAMTQKIQSMAAEGANAKIEGTPSVFINNKALSGGQFLPVLQGLYQELKSGH